MADTHIQKQILQMEDSIGSQAAKGDNSGKTCSTELKWNEMFPGSSSLH